jgi:hydroxypyruvate isomerase
MNGLRFCANLGWLFTELSLERRFAAAAKAGFTAVEHASPYTLSADRWRALLDDAGLEQALINMPAGPDGAGWGCLPDRVDEFRSSVERALEYAVVLGCPLVQLRAGLRPPDLPADTALARFTANVVWAAQRAAAAGVRLTLEAVNERDLPGYFLTTQEAAAAIAQAAGPEHVGVQFDIYHCQIAQGDITTRLEALFPLIAHVQVADAPSRTEPGTGEISWAYIFQRLARLDYSGWIGCEYRPENGTADGLGWLEAFS